MKKIFLASAMLDKSEHFFCIIRYLSVPVKSMYSFQRMSCYEYYASSFFGKQFLPAVAGETY